MTTRELDFKQENHMITMFHHRNSHQAEKAIPSCYWALLTTQGVDKYTRVENFTSRACENSAVLQKKTK